MAPVASTEVADQRPWFLKTSCPVQFPHHPALDLSDDEFDQFLKKELAARHDSTSESAHEAKEDVEMSDSFTQIDTPAVSTTADIKEDMGTLDIAEDHESAGDGDDKPQHPFIAGLTSYGKEGPDRDMSNMMLTDNADLTNASSKDARVDLFYELEEAVAGPRLRDLLSGAWATDPLLTLKIIFNARSIHLGKASRTTFYHSAGWLAQEHPLTLISNLKWLSRPVIEKKAANKSTQDKDIVLVEEEATGDAAYDVKNGVAHGYWKDMLNLVVLSVNGKLDPLAKARHVLSITNHGKEPVTEEKARERRHKLRDDRHETAIQAFENNHVHRCLHLAVARLFASQLRKDLDLLNSNDPRSKRRISLCAKWAPSVNRFHDKHTFIVTTIAELLHTLGPVQEGDDAARELAIRHAREEYRKSVSALRAHLEVVERDLTAKTFSNIQYERIPSIAMNNYAKIFATKDTERFEQYLDRVASGESQISGAVLLPSTLIKAVRCAPNEAERLGDINTRKRVDPKKLIELRARAMEAVVVDNQWKTLVQRIKDSGTLSSSIAVCDVSGSMNYPCFPDGTAPMDSSIGLSLLLAEVTAPPFGGHFITFSSEPTVQSIDLGMNLGDKYRELCRASWDMSTDLVAVFEDLILPMAVKNKLSQEDMVKRVFVFSDMQFNAACRSGDSWTTSFERIKRAYADAGYEMPQLVFWNLAGHHLLTGVSSKPVTTDDNGTALVSGYSQGMLKVFLDNGSFEDPEEEEVVVEEIQDEETGEAVRVTKRQKMDPLTVVRKAVSNKAYDMLKVLD